MRNFQIFVRNCERRKEFENVDPSKQEKAIYGDPKREDLQLGELLPQALRQRLRRVAAGGLRADGLGRRVRSRAHVRQLPLQGGRFFRRAAALLLERALGLRLPSNRAECASAETSL